MESVATFARNTQSAEGAPEQVTRGAFESYEAGRACEVSSACHWVVNMAAAAHHGRMYGHAYSVGVAALERFRQFAHSESAP